MLEERMMAILRSCLLQEVIFNEITRWQPSRGLTIKTEATVPTSPPQIPTIRDADITKVPIQDSKPPLLANEGQVGETHTPQSSPNPPTPNCLSHPPQMSPQAMANPLDNQAPENQGVVMAAQPSVKRQGSGTYLINATPLASLRSPY